MGLSRPAAGAFVVAAFMVPALAAGAGDRTPPASTPASEASLKLSYNMYMLGLPLGSVDVSARIERGAYQAQSVLDTKGLISIFWQAHIEAQSNGRLTPIAMHPALYAATSHHGSNVSAVTVTYDGDHPVNVVLNPPRNRNKYPVTEAQQRNTVDPLSAMLFVASGITASDTNPCGTAAPVYDGRRRYDVQLTFLKRSNVTMGNGVYKGLVMVCQVHYVQIAGFKQKILAEGKRLPPMYAWIASIPSRNDPNRRYLIPIRLWAETNWGTAAAEVQRVEVDGADAGHAS